MTPIYICSGNKTHCSLQEGDLTAFGRTTCQESYKKEKGEQISYLKAKIQLSTKRISQIRTEITLCNTRLHSNFYHGEKKVWMPALQKLHYLLKSELKYRKLLKKKLHDTL